MSIVNDVVWVEKYRPHKVADCILPNRLKGVFQAIVNSGDIPNLLLYGTPGTGKTSVAKAMCEELGLTYYFSNGSKDRGIDVIRNEITSFASTIAFNGKRKVIIIDEADGATGDYQAAMKASIEEFSKNCSFIFTANQPGKVIEAIHSRCIGIEFKLLPQEKDEMALALFKRLITILKNEGKPFEQEAVGLLMMKHFPDNRRIINELQRFALVDGLKNDTVKSLLDSGNYGVLYEALKTKNLKDVRQWVVAHVDASHVDKFIRVLYDNMKTYLRPESIPAAVMIFGEWQYKAAFVADQEINTVAHLTDMMSQCEFL